MRSCLLALNVDDSEITASTFRKARKNWIGIASEARMSGDVESELIANCAWQSIKNWICSVCGGPKPRTRNEVCGRRECVNKYTHSRIRKKAGPITLRFNPRSREQTSSYCGHELRRVQYELLKRTLDSTGQNVSETARKLKMSRHLCQYYMRKFGWEAPCSKQSAQ